MPSKLLTAKQVAEILGVTTRTLDSWRLKGGGPDYVTLARNAIRYRETAVEEFISSRERKRRAGAAA